MQNRLKSKVFWFSLITLIAEALKLFGVYTISNENLSILQDIVTIVFQVFASLNNPTSKNSF